ncbi:hypothetical protein QKW35_06035 [Pontibacterium granulatum]|uniref:hypothetical protein n=1 Tax=Pontibacterium granulatum TaxID=2036029 RepID=UPI00249CC9F5|nr:hypothetical protein [Pontibacterium granulatum]MDI3323928.1 hypothetical protein [Pontibacterium granulatum]
MSKTYTLTLDTDQIETISNLLGTDLEKAEQRLVQLRDGALRVSDEEEAILYCRAAELDAIVRKIEAVTWKDFPTPGVGANEVAPGGVADGPRHDKP